MGLPVLLRGLAPNVVSEPGPSGLTGCSLPQLPSAGPGQGDTQRPRGHMPQRLKLPHAFHQAQSSDLAASSVLFTLSLMNDSPSPPPHHDMATW